MFYRKFVFATEEAASSACKDYPASVCHQSGTFPGEIDDPHVVLVHNQYKGIAERIARVGTEVLDE